MRWIKFKLKLDLYDLFIHVPCAMFNVQHCVYPNVFENGILCWEINSITGYLYPTRFVDSLPSFGNLEFVFADACKCWWRCVKVFWENKKWMIKTKGIELSPRLPNAIHVQFCTADKLRTSAALWTVNSEPHCKWFWSVYFPKSVR